MAFLHVYHGIPTLLLWHYYTFIILLRTSCMSPEVTGMKFLPFDYFYYKPDVCLRRSLTRPKLSTTGNFASMINISVPCACVCACACMRACACARGVIADSFSSTEMLMFRVSLHVRCQLEFEYRYVCLCAPMTVTHLHTDTPPCDHTMTAVLSMERVSCLLP